MDRELMETILSRLPAPCAPMTERRKAAWIRLVQAVLDFCYCDEEQSDAPVALLEARVLEERDGEIRLPRNIQAERAAEVAPRRTNYFQAKKNPGKSSPLVSAVRQAFSSNREKSLSKKEVVAWLEKHRTKDLAHLVNVATSVYQCVKKLEDRRELESDVRDGVTVWRLVN